MHWMNALNFANRGEDRFWLGQLVWPLELNGKRLGGYKWTHKLLDEVQSFQCINSNRSHRRATQTRETQTRETQTRTSNEICANEISNEKFKWKNSNERFRWKISNESPKMDEQVRHDSFRSIRECERSLGETTPRNARRRQSTEWPPYDVVALCWEYGLTCIQHKTIDMFAGRRKIV